jgi:hypothetical protein
MATAKTWCADPELGAKPEEGGRGCIQKRSDPIPGCPVVPNELAKLRSLMAWITVKLR